MNFPSNSYQEWERSAGIELLKYKGLKLPKVEIQMEFWMPDNRRTDLDNKVSSIFDMLKRAEIIADDCWQVIDFHSAKSRGVCKEMPRVEIWIQSIPI